MKNLQKKKKKGIPLTRLRKSALSFEKSLRFWSTKSAKPAMCISWVLWQLERYLKITCITSHMCGTQKTCRDETVFFPWVYWVKEIKRKRETELLNEGPKAKISRITVHIFPPYVPLPVKSLIVIERVLYLYKCIKYIHTYMCVCVHHSQSPSHFGEEKDMWRGQTTSPLPLFTVFPFSIFQNSAKPLSTSTSNASTICTIDCPHVLFHLGKGGKKNYESEWIRQTLTFKGFPKDLLNKKEEIY